jgi:hypothetical protein
MNEELKKAAIEKIGVGKCGVTEICDALKNNVITYEEAKALMEDFSKEGLVWFILNPYKQEVPVSGVTCN